MSSDRHNLLKAWIAAILWLIVIAIESSSIGSSSNTGRFLYPLLHFLFKLDPFHFEQWHFFIRKGGHVFGYGLLSILFFRAWHATLPSIENLRWSFRWANLAVLGTAFVASLDELGCPIRIYGTPRRGRVGRLTFLPPSDLPFLEDLASCLAVMIRRRSSS